jgi:hypothetical protein
MHNKGKYTLSKRDLLNPRHYCCHFLHYDIRLLFILTLEVVTLIMYDVEPTMW